MSLKQDRGFFHRMRVRVQIKQAMQWCNVRFLFTYFLSTNHQVCQNWAKIEECGWAIFSPPILSEEFWTADSKCWRRPNQETYLLGTKSFFVVEMFAIIPNTLSVNSLFRKCLFFKLYGISGRNLDTTDRLYSKSLNFPHNYVDLTSSLPFGFW